jgi:nucleoside-diphosphate-sugar epimerase
MTHALVTGASGFTGSRLANELARRGNQVRAMVRRTSDLSLLDRSYIESGSLAVCYGDITDQQSIQEAVHGVDHVYHVAALYRVAKFADQMYWDVNVEGTRNILQAAERHGVQRIMHCSTIGVHGGVKEIPADEDSPYAPSDVYQATKLEGEKLAQEAICNGQPVSIIRPAGIYGPGDLRFLKLFSMVKSGRFIMFGSGETLMHMVFIDDLVDGMIQAVEHQDGVGKTMILAGEKYVSLSELVTLVSQATDATRPRWHLPLWPLMTAAAGCEWVCRPLGFEPPLHRRRAAFFTKDRAFSIERAKREIGYHPKVELAAGLRRTAEWYIQQNLLA